MLELGIASEREFDHRVSQVEFTRWIAFFQERNRRLAEIQTKARSDAEHSARRGR